MARAYFSCSLGRRLRVALACVPGLGLLSLPAATSGCPGNCATYVVAVVLQDDATGNLVCDGSVALVGGSGDATSSDAGQTLSPSTAASDAEVSPSQASCQWDVVIGGGSYQVVADAPGFTRAVVSLKLPSDVCGSSSLTVTAMLVRGPPMPSSDASVRD